MPNKSYLFFSGWHKYRVQSTGYPGDVMVFSMISSVLSRLAGVCQRKNKSGYKFPSGRKHERNEWFQVAYVIILLSR